MLDDSDPTAAELGAADQIGLEELLYLQGRRGGANHNDVLAAYEEGVDMWGYGWLTRAGWTHDQVLALHQEDADVNGFAHCLEEGASEHEAREARALSINLRNYAFCREVNVGHRHALDLHRKCIDLGGYASAFRQGAVDSEILEAFAEGMNLYDYAQCREGKASHLEALELAHYFHDTNASPVFAYRMARNVEATHTEILEALRLGCRIEDYERLRSTGQEHNNAVQILVGGESVYSYANAGQPVRGANRLTSPTRLEDFVGIGSVAPSYEPYVSDSTSRSLP